MEQTISLQQDKLNGTDIIIESQTHQISSLKQTIEDLEQELKNKDH